MRASADRTMPVPTAAPGPVSSVMSPRVIVFAVTPGVLAPAVVVSTKDAMTSEPANTATVIDFVRNMEPPFLQPHSKQCGGIAESFLICSDTGGQAGIGRVHATSSRFEASSDATSTELKTGRK